MRNSIEIYSKNQSLTRRSFLKYTGAATSLYLTSRWLRNPSLVLANSKSRVVSVHNSNATNWDFTTGYHWEFINQSAVNNMVTTGIMSLTSTTNVLEAWNRLIPYQPGDAVAIKVNFNNHYDCVISDEQKIDAYSETVNAVIDGLTLIGVPSNKIWITDPSRVIPNRFIERIKNEDVQYYCSVSRCSSNSQKTGYVNVTSPAATQTTHPPDDIVRPAQVFVDAKHLINIPQLKGHGAGWITLGLKNHYGSVTFKNDVRSGDERMRCHDYIMPHLNSDIEKSLLADISNNPHIRDKTRLIIGDGLFGHPVSNHHSVKKWQIFGDETPNLLFFGTDPIATDSVMCDYINEEQNRTIGMTVTHSSLHYGSAIGLGIHDHWDSFETKRYSLIDYIHIDLDNPSINRVDVDRKIKEFKAGDTTEQEVKDIIEQYMEMQS